jgi:hypothetical protein
MNYIKAQIDSGWELKEEVRNATTQEELDGFIDNRGIESLPPPTDGAQTPEPPAEPPPEPEPPAEPPPESGEGDTGDEPETPPPEGDTENP